MRLRFEVDGPLLLPLLDHVDSGCFDVQGAALALDPPSDDDDGACDDYDDGDGVVDDEVGCQAVKALDSPDLTLALAHLVDPKVARVPPAKTRSGLFWGNWGWEDEKMRT